MKILFIHHGTGVGGAAISLLQMIVQLKKTEQISLIFTEHSEAVSFFENRDVKINDTLGIPAFSHTVIWWYSLSRFHHFFSALFGVFWVFWNGKKILKKYRPKILHLNSSPLWPWLFWSWALNIPSVCHIREPLASGYFGLRRWLISSWIKLFANKILAVCQNDGKLFRDSKKLEILYNAVNQDIFNPQKIMPKKKHKNMTFLYLGGALEEKGILFLLKTWRQVQHQNPEARLLIAGPWEKNLNSTSQLGTLARRLGIQTPKDRLFKQIKTLLVPLKDSVKILGLQKKPVQIIAGSDCLLFPCQVGHFARPVIEAAFLGIASVASNLAPLDELIAPEKTGFLIESSNAEIWSQKILFLIKNPTSLKKMGLAAQSQAKSKFSLFSQISQLKSTYKTIINQK